jgi:hypothetical protein
MSTMSKHGAKTDNGTQIPQVRIERVQFWGFCAEVNRQYDGLDAVKRKAPDVGATPQTPSSHDQNKPSLPPIVYNPNILAFLPLTFRSDRLPNGSSLDPWRGITRVLPSGQRGPGFERHRRRIIINPQLGVSIGVKPSGVFYPPFLREWRGLLLLFFIAACYRRASKG